MNHHAVSIKWSDEDNGYIATVPQLPGLSAFGATREEALSELDTAANAYMVSLKQSGRPVPEPEKIKYYSGQIRLRMPKSLHASLASGAKENNVSLNTYLITLLSERHTLSEVMKRVSNQAMQPPIQDDQILHGVYPLAKAPSKIDEASLKYKKQKAHKK